MPTDRPLLEGTPYGFRWGPATVERVASAPRVGVVIAVVTRHGKRVYIRVSPSGRKISVESQP